MMDDPVRMRLPYGRQTALVVVDVQNDFADRKGSLYVVGGDAVPGIINVEIGYALAAGGAVFYTQDWHPAQTPHFVTDGGIWPVHCVAGTWGARLHRDLVVEGPSVKKGTAGEDGYSGFTVRDPRTGHAEPTELEELLREADMTTVVVVGLATDYCVKETALDAVAKGFETVVPTHGLAAVNLEPGDGERALEAMREAGVRIV